MVIIHEVWIIIKGNEIDIDRHYTKAESFDAVEPSIYPRVSVGI